MTDAASTSKQFRNRAGVFVAALFAALSFGTAAHAQTTYTWGANGSAAGGTGTWDTSNARWLSGATWSFWNNTANDIAYFGGSSAGTVTLSTGIQANGLTFATTGYLITGGSLTLAGSTPTLTVNTGVTGTIASLIAGTGGFTKSGAGTLALSSSNSISGAVTLNSGTIVISNMYALGAGTLTAGGGTLDSSALVTVATGTIANAISVNSALTVAYGYGNTYSGALSGASNITFTGTMNTLFLNQNVQNYSGVIVINSSSASGYVRIANASSTTWQNQKIDLQGSTVAQRDGLNGTQQLGAVSGSANTILRTGNGTVTYDVGYANTDAAFAGTITDNASKVTSIQKSGSGIWALSGANTYTGTTTAANGVLRLDSAGALPGGIGATGGSSGLTINGGVVGLGNGDFSRPLGTGSSAVQWTGGGGFAAYTADRSVNLGGASATVTWASGNFVPNSSALVLGATSADKTITLQNPIDLNGATRTVQVDDGTAAVDAVLSGALSGSSGGLTKTGAGVLRLAVANTFGGATTVSAGTLLVSDASALQNSTLASGGVVFDSAVGGNAFSIGGLSGSGTISLANNAGSPAAIALTVGGNGGSTSFSGLLSGAGSLTKAGAGGLTLSSSNSFTGGVALNSGTLAISNMYALGTGTLTAGGGTLNSSALGNTATIANAIAVNSPLTVAYGYGNTYSGALSGASNITFTGQNSQNAMFFNQNVTSYSGTIVINASSATDYVRIANASSATWQNQKIDLQGSTVAQRDGLIGTQALGAVSGAAGTILRAGNGNVTYDVGYANTDATFAGTITDNATTGRVTSIQKSGSGIWALSGSNSYTGATTVSAGRLGIGETGSLNSTSGITVNGSTAEFRYNSSTALTQPLTLTRGTLSGTGSIGSAVSVGSNAILSPGNSPGSQSFTQGLTFDKGGRYTWEINDWAGSSGIGYDQLAVSGSALNITATSGSTFTIAITGLTAGNVAGIVPGFSPGTTSATFTIATSVAGITGFDRAKFKVDSSGFTTNNPLPTNAGFWLSTNGGSTSLILNYAPSATYNLSAAATATSIRVGGTSTITATITSSTSAVTGPDSLAYTGLALSGGVGSLSSTSGSLAGGLSGSGSAAFTTLTSGSYAFTPSVTSATNVNIGTNANAGSTSGASVLVYNPSSANTIASVSLGNIRAGSAFGTQTLSIWNTGTASATYQEGLAASISGTSGAASGSGSFGNLYTSSTSTAISVGLAGANTATGGALSGSVTIGFTSTGTTSGGATGLTPLALGSQTVAVTGTVWNTAVGGITSATSVNLGVIHAGGSFTAASVAIANAAATGGFSEGLNATVSGSGGVATSGGTGITNLGAGISSSSITVSLGDTGSAGTKNGTITIGYQSNGSTTSGLGTISAGSQTVSLTGGVFSGNGIWNVNGGGSWGTGASSSWRSTENVSAAPGTFAGFANTDTATFSDAISSGTAAINTAGANISLKSLEFNNSAGSYEIYQTGGSGALTLLAAGTNSAGITVSAGSHTIHADVTLGSSTVIDVATNASLTLHTAISGLAAFGLTKTGSGTLYFDGSSSAYYGNTDIVQGMVRLLSGAKPLGTGTVTVRAGATLDLNNLSLTNTLNVLSGGILLNTGSSQNTSVSDVVIFSGTTNGTVTVGTGGNATFGSTVAGSVSVGNGAKATFTSESPLTGSLGVSSGGVVDFNGSNTPGSTFNVFSGGLVNVGSAASIGGQLHVSGSAVIAGLVTSNADVVVESGGNVKFVDGASFAQTSLKNDGTLVFERSTNLSVAAAISGSGGLQKTGAGTLFLSGNNGYTGATTISAGVVSIAAANALASTSGVSIAGGAGLTYTGGAGTLDRPITVTGGVGTVTNSGTGTLTLAGTLTKNGTVLQLSGGAFNVTGQIVGSSSNSDLYVNGASVTLSNTNSYNGPTYVFNGGTLIAGTNSAIPSDSVVTLGASGTGSATEPGTLDLGSSTNTIAGLVFSGSGNTLKMAANQTAAPQLATNSSMSLGAGTALDLTGMGTSAGLYKLVSYTSNTGTFTMVNGLADGYQLVYGTTELDAQQKAVLGTVTVTNPMTSIITGGSAAFTYTVANGAASGGASLLFTGSGNSTVAGSSNGSAAAAGVSSSVAGLYFTGMGVGFDQAGTFNVSAPDAYGLTTATGTVSVNVLDHATSSLAATLLTSTTISLGQWNYKTGEWEIGTGTGAFSIYNLASHYGVNLTADLSLLSVSGDGNGFSTDLNSFLATIAGGTSSQFSISFDPTGLSSRETLSTTFAISTSDKTGMSGATASNTLYVTASVIVVPEPDTIIFAGIGIAMAGWSLWKRRRIARVLQK